MKKLLLLSFLFLFLVNCNDNDDVNPDAMDCTEVACTEIFISLMVTVKDKDGVLIPLDRFEVIDRKTSEDLTPRITFDDFQMARQSGQYPLYDDSFVSEYQNTKRTILFRGFINEDKIAEAEYIIETDCCHVSIALGDTTITIN